MPLLKRTSVTITLQNGLPANICSTRHEKYATLCQYCRRNYPFELGEYSKYALEITVEGCTVDLLLNDHITQVSKIKHLIKCFSLNELCSLVIFVVYNEKIYSPVSEAGSSIIAAIKQKINPLAYQLLT